MKKFLTRVFIICFISVFSNEVKAQISKEKLSRSTVSEIEGTYQVEFLKSNEGKAFALTTDIIQKIDALRKDNSVTYLKISDGCRLKIFSANQIKQKDFKIKEDYVIVDKFEN